MTTSTFWVVFQRGSNASTTASYRDRLGAAYDSNYQTAVLPDATEISSGFDLSGNFIGTQAYDNSVKHVVLAYSAETLISASSTTLSTGAFVLVCPTGTTIDKIEIRAIDNTLIASSIGSWNSTSSIGNLPTPTFTGTGDWSETARWNTASVPVSTDNVIIDGDATISTDLEVSALTINASKSLTVNAAKQLTVTGALTNNGTLNLLSTDAGTATLKAATTSGNGSYKVQQYLTNQSWYLTSPVNGTVTPTNLSRIQGYNEGVGTGNDWSVSGTTMTALKGYITTVSDEPKTIEFTGTINNGDISIPLTRQAAGNENKYGFNLIGNPYTAYLDWKAVATANAAKMPTSTMWYRTKVSGSWDFSTVNGLGESSPENVSDMIPPMQAFWVRASTTGSSTLSLTNDMVFHDNNASNKMKAPAASNTDRTRIRLQVSNGTKTDELLIYTDAKSLNSFDTYDSPKMSNENVDIPEISCIVGTESLVINGLNDLMLDTALPLRFMTKTANSFTLKANQVSNLPQGVRVILKDDVTEFDLTNGTSYNFTSDIADNTNRFSIIFRSPSVISGLENNNTVNFNVYANAKGQLTVSLPLLTGNDVVAVYNSTGQRVMSQKLTNTQTLLNNTFAAGVYVVRVNEVSHKVIVK
jgi:hypothetical protein